MGKNIFVIDCVYVHLRSYKELRPNAHIITTHPNGILSCCTKLVVSSTIIEQFLWLVFLWRTIGLTQLVIETYLSKNLLGKIKTSDQFINVHWISNLYILFSDLKDQGRA